MSKGFDCFVGIDWSGAKGQYHRGIQLAMLTAKSDSPQYIEPPDKRGWSRQMVMDWLHALTASGHRVLAGFDFAFAHPFVDTDSYFPDYANSPQTPCDLWALADAASHHLPHQYGGGIWHDADLRQGGSAWDLCNQGNDESYAFVAHRIFFIPIDFH